jgi:hypothetical protein
MRGYHPDQELQLRYKPGRPDEYGNASAREPPYVVPAGVFRAPAIARITVKSAPHRLTGRSALAVASGTAADEPDKQGKFATLREAAERSWMNG